MDHVVTAIQIRGARGMLDWSLIDLAAAARVSVSTVKRAESGGTEAVSPATVGLIRKALETAGVQFLADEREGAGLRLRARQPSPVARFV